MYYVFLAEGFEEIEAITPVDILRRAGLSVTTVGVTGKTITGAHDIPVLCDIQINEWNDSEPAALILPGGMPGTKNLESCEKLAEILCQNQSRALLCAICAAPSVLGELGLLRGKKAVCFPGFESSLLGAHVQSACPVVTDGGVITARGAGAAAEFGFAIVEKALGAEAAQKLRNTMCYL